MNIEEIKRRYTIPRPEMSRAVYPVVKPTLHVVVGLLSGSLVFGLLALFWSAFVAFDQVHPSIQSLFYAGVIEIGAIAEALTIVRAKGKDRPTLWVAVIALVISVVVSATYNYIQVASAASDVEITNNWQIWSLALGPLAAVLSLALTVGKQYGQYEEQLQEWETKQLEFNQSLQAEYDGRLANWTMARQAWIDAEVLRAETIEREDKLRAEKRERRSIRRSDERSERPHAEHSTPVHMNESSSTIEKMNDARRANRSTKLNALVQIYATHPGASYQDAADKLTAGGMKASKGWVGGAVPELISAGRLVVNGHGVQASDGS